MIQLQAILEVHLTLGSGSTLVWKEKIKAGKHLANLGSTGFFLLLEEICIHFDVRKYWESSRVSVFEEQREAELSQ